MPLVVNRIAAKVAALVREQRNEMNARFHIKGYGDIVHISDELRAEIWYKFIGKTDPMTNQFKKTLITLFSAQEKEILVVLSKLPEPKTSGPKYSIGYMTPEGVIPKLTAEQQRFAELWEHDQKKWREEFMDGGKPHIEGGTYFGGGLGMDAAGSAVQFDPTDVRVTDFVKKRSFKFAQEVNQTTEKLLKRELVAGLEAGESKAEIAKRVEEVFDHCKKSRSQTIAQTEIIGATNKGSNEGYRQSGVVWGSQWIGALDEHIREDHETLTTQEVAVPLGEMFPIVDLEYPGDSGGAAEQVINCRCTTKPLTKDPEATGG